MKAVLAFTAMVLSAGAAQATQAELNKMRTSDFLLKTAPAGCQAKGMKADSRGEYLYVADMCGGRDPKTGKFVTEADGKRAATVSVYDLKRMELVKSIVTPRGAIPGKPGNIGNAEVDFTVGEDYLLVARIEGTKDVSVFPGFGMLTAINTTTKTVTKHIPVKGSGAKTIARRPSVQGEGNREIVYVANYFSDDVSVLDVTSLNNQGGLDGSSMYLKKVRLKTAFPPANKAFYKIAPRGMTFTPDGKYALILATQTGTIIIMDSVNHTQLAELPPMPVSIAGREVNVRHIVATFDGKYGYLSHMHGNGVSRIDIPKLVAIAKTAGGQTLPQSTWNQIVVPFPNGKKVLTLDRYSKEHPNFPGQTWPYAHPNTIVLDPVNNRYLYVSYRTTSNANYEIIDPKIKGKIDVIDTKTGEVIFSLTGGSQPTALEVTADNRMLISAGFKDEPGRPAQVYFFDIDKMIRIYESGSMSGLR